MLYPSETWTYVRTGIAALGASGVVIGFGAATACLVPEMEFFLFGVVPVPLWLTGQGYFVWDAFHLSNPYSAVGHASHVAGGACGVLYYLWELKKLGGIYYGL